MNSGKEMGRKRCATCERQEAISKMKTGWLGVAVTLGLGLALQTAQGGAAGGYQLLDSITSTGTQWINTGYRPNANTRVEASFNTKFVKAHWGIYFGCSSVDAEAPDGFQLRRDAGSDRLSAWFGGAAVTVASRDHVDVEVALEKGGLWFNGRHHAFAATDWNGTIPLYLFAGYCAKPEGGNTLYDRANRVYRPQAMRLYSFRIREKGALVHDYVPVRQLATGKLGLLDLVAYRKARTCGFFANCATSGADFTPGTVTNALDCADAKAGERHYEANWDSLDRHPIPQWFKDAKFGIFIHWGPYAVPAYAPPDAKSIWARYAEQYQTFILGNRAQCVKHHREKYHNAPYSNFAAEFKAENYDPAEWADLFKRAGARYAVMTSKHWDGFALWPSPLSPYYNAMAMGPGRDLAGDFITAMRAAGLKCGFYYTFRETANPRFLEANRNKKLMPKWAAEICHPQMKDLVERYKIDILCPDGEHDLKHTNLGALDFLKWLYNESSMRDTIAVSDRWGNDCWDRHGGYWTGEYTRMRTNARVFRTGIPQIHHWEEWRALGWSFGWNKFEHAWDYMSEEECIETLAFCVSSGGNLLLDIGPTADGRIPVIMQDRLLAMGRWLKVNGEAIYDTTYWLTPDYKAAAGRHLYFTRKGGTLYAITFRWPDGTRPVVMRDVGRVKGVTLVGAPDAKVDWKETAGTLTFTAPPLAPDRLPCQHAWVFRITR